MDTKLEEAPVRIAEDASPAPAVRTVRYPSTDFPVPPGIEFVVPETWRPVGAAVVNEMTTRPDVAVAGPDVVDGVRPNIMAKVSRVPVTGRTTAPTPTEVLEALFAQQHREEETDGFECRIRDDEPDGRPYGVSRYTEHLGWGDVFRLTLAVIVATGPVVHLVIVQAGTSPSDEGGRTAVEAAFASLRVSTPGPIGTTGEPADG